MIAFSLPALDVGPLEPEVLALGIGHYQATVDLGFAGNLGSTDPSANGRVRVGFRGRHDHGRVAVAAERRSARGG